MKPQFSKKKKPKNIDIIFVRKCTVSTIYINYCELLYDYNIHGIC